ncbi:hypothetical protein [uncultured Dialister sp.]|nr:hypothetical protein [uncultured Dialister sp.]
MKFICRFAAVGSISVEYHFVMRHCTPLRHFVALFTGQPDKRKALLWAG